MTITALRTQVIFLSESLQTSKMKNANQKKKYKKYNFLSIMKVTVDTFVFFNSISISVNLSITDFGSLVIPLSTGTACELSSNKLLIFRVKMNKYHYFKNFANDQNKLLNF